MSYFLLTWAWGSSYTSAMSLLIVRTLKTMAVLAFFMALSFSSSNTYYTSCSRRLMVTELLGKSLAELLTDKLSSDTERDSDSDNDTTLLLKLDFDIYDEL